MKPAMSIRTAGLMRSLCLAATLALSACAMPDPASHSLLGEEVSSLVKDGMPLSEAVNALGSRGFSCGEGTSITPSAKGIFECTRSRAPWWPPYGCIQRIWFKAAAPNGAISNLQVFKPSCASL